MPEKKQTRKRPHTLLNEGISAPQSTQRKNVASQSDQDGLVIDPITTLQAVPSLHQFPPELRTEIDRYFKMPGANKKTFVANKKKFDLNYTAKGQPAIFVEMGTMNLMDAASYLCGPVLHPGLMVVVKPKDGSSFNDGNAAIITFYGKGSDADGRDVISRWAIWTPDGIKRDILIDRLVTGPGPEPQPDEEGTTGRTKKRRYTRRSQNYREDSSDEGLDQDQGAIIHGEGLIKEERAATDSDSNLFVPEDSQDDEGDIPYRPCSPRLPPINHNRPSDGLLQPTTPRTVPEVKLGDEGVLFAFTAAPGGDTLLSKTITQCNSVQRLFAYAFKAGISGTEVVMLNASIGGSTVHIVRDDEEDFAELVHAIENQRKAAGGDQVIRVTVTPMQF